MKRFAAVWTMLLLLAAPAAAWQELEPGLSFGEFHAPRPPTADAIISVLRIDPARFRFRILMASEHGEPRTLAAWAEQFRMAATINASMYLPNNRTSTGLMRCDDHLNNGTINRHFGAFFMAGPKRAGIPQARLVDRTEDDWRRALDDYDCVAQNYRMIAAGGKVLWRRDGNAFSIAAVAEDDEGNILFLHCRAPLSVHDFATHLLDLPLGVRRAMYVEGGREAGMYVSTPVMTRAWSGSYATFIFQPGAPHLHPLPNVIGIERRAAR